MRLGVFTVLYLSSPRSQAFRVELSRFWYLLGGAKSCPFPASRHCAYCTQLSRCAFLRLSVLIEPVQLRQCTHWTVSPWCSESTSSNCECV